MDDPIIPRKWKLGAHGVQNVFVWGELERSVHTLMKAFLWALYLPQYPTLTVEVRANDPRYKPDVVAMPTVQDIFRVQSAPSFWGEAGQVSKEKIETLVRRYPQTHLALAKWDTSLRPYQKLIEDALRGVKRSAPFDLLIFPPESKEKFITPSGEISVTFDALDWKRFEG